MSSIPPPIAPTKSLNSTPQLSPAHSQHSPSTANESLGQRRSGGTGSSGAGSSSRSLLASPRNNQSAKKQNKGSKRFRFVDEDAFVESNAMRSTNGRKGQTSITHLMNFSLPPRPQQNRTSNSYRAPRRTWGMGSGYHAIDKARYVHANYRFIVDPRADYHTQSIDADIHLEWNNVLQILVSAQSQAGSCPICLGTPVAPRMAKCGHIFCLPCLIRYMHSEDSAQNVPEKKARWKKCPICYDSVYVSETRPVRWHYGQEGEQPQENQDLVLRLVTRSAGSTLALPRDGAEILDKDEDIPWHVAAEVMDYARIIKGGEDYMNEQYDNDIAELEKQEKEDEVMFGEDNVEWMRKAIRAVKDGKDRLQNIGNPPKLPTKPVEAKNKRPPITFHTHSAPEIYSLQSDSKSGQSLPAVTGAQEPHAQDGGQQHGSGSNIQHEQQQAANCQPSEYFFYQALLHYYLSPLDIRILKAEFGAFSSFPSTILPRIEHVSTGHMVDDELRKRTKYLAHLPYGCEVAFLECDWTDTVSPEVLEKFKPEIERRRKRHQDKTNREEKSRVRAEKMESEQYRRAKRSSIPNDTFSANDFVPLQAASPSTAELAVGSLETDPMSSSPPYPARRTQGSAFATLASPGTSPNTSRTVWGTSAIAPSSPVMYARQEPEADDGWLQGWEKDLLTHDEDVAVQLQAMGIGEASSSKAVSGGGQKRGKKKKITLMSTNVRRGA